MLTNMVVAVFLKIGNANSKQILTPTPTHIHPPPPPPLIHTHTHTLAPFRKVSSSGRQMQVFKLFSQNQVLCICITLTVLKHKLPLKLE